MPLKRLKLSKPYEPKTSGLTYLNIALRAQSRGKVATYLTIPYSKAKEISELWKKDKALLKCLTKELITQSVRRHSVLESRQKQS